MAQAAAPLWLALIQERLAERDVREGALNEVIASYQRLSQYVVAARKTQSSPAARPSVATPPPAPPAVDATPTKRAPGPVSDADSTALRAELAEMYKTQSANAQRLLSLTDALAAREAALRQAQDELARSGEELVRVRRGEEDARLGIREKEKLVELLQDELSALSLELNQVEARNDALKRDNASLLQRWLDRMNDEAAAMNLRTEEEERRVQETRAARAEAGLREASTDSATGG